MEKKKKNYYFDPCSNNDYDNIIRFLLKKSMPILQRDKMKLTIAAEVPEDFDINELYNQVEFEETLSHGDTPLE